MDWSLPYSKENKAFFLHKLHQNFTKFSKFSLPLQSLRGDVDTTMLTLVLNASKFTSSDGGSDWEAGLDEVAGKFFSSLTSVCLYVM